MASVYTGAGPARAAKMLARGYEQYARRYAGAKMLLQAVIYRQALGQNEDSIANIELFIR